jgi:hypothetical protein
MDGNCKEIMSNEMMTSSSGNTNRVGAVDGHLDDRGLGHLLQRVHSQVHCRVRVAVLLPLLVHERIVECGIKGT